MAAGRFAATIAYDDPDRCAIALLGLPDDIGVSLNNGRPGAAHAPAAFREALAKYGTTFDAAAERELPPLVYDAGDIVPASTDDFDNDPVAAMNETHDRVTEAVFAIHKRGLLPVCIGGGHDLTFPSVRALSQHLGRAVAGVNVDAHLDVRDTPGSGMPYRALIEGGFVDATRFVEYGIGRFATARAHVEWLASRFAEIVTIDRARTPECAPQYPMEFAFDARDDGHEHEPGFVSIDLDAIDGSAAPGVSAVNPDGLSVMTTCEIARRAGAHPAVRHFDIMELNPKHDDGRTARIAALVFLHFVAGYAERIASASA
jgi:formiminoglutamase